MTTLTLKISLENWEDPTTPLWTATLQLAAKNTLDDLAKAIIDTVGFYFDHAYGFYDNLRNPFRSKQKYTLFSDLGVEMYDEELDPGVKNVQLHEVFVPRRKMLFLFDYGDNWEFIVTCKKREELANFKKVKVLATTGTAPEQYPDYEEEE